ncbi:MAG: hypothetical protein RLZZ177_2974, partial [Pseudomonadota bacterium]
MELWERHPSAVDEKVLPRDVACGIRAQKCDGRGDLCCPTMPSSRYRSGTFCQARLQVNEAEHFTRGVASPRGQDGSRAYRIDCDATAGDVHR